MGTPDYKADIIQIDSSINDFLRSEGIGWNDLGWQIKNVGTERLPKYDIVTTGTLVQLGGAKGEIFVDDNDASGTVAMQAIRDDVISARAVDIVEKANRRIEEHTEQWRIAEQIAGLTVREIQFHGRSVMNHQGYPVQAILENVIQILEGAV